MKRLIASLIIGFMGVTFCVAQVQPGNASYNASKTGFTISHASLSFNTRVKVTNLRNNRFVEAVVNGRIPISADRIADISRDAGDALEMDKNGMTLVQIEELPPRVTESVPSGNQAQTVPNQPQSLPPTVVTQTQVLPVQTVTDVQYIPVPSAPAQPCCSAPLILAILLLLILVIAILVVVLILLHRRLPLWPWYYPLWIRRRRYLKRTGTRLR
jgi:hypothetical protein